MHRHPGPRLTPARDRRPARAFPLPLACTGCLHAARPFRPASTCRRNCEGAMLELCENTTRPSPRQRSHPRLDSYEVLHSDGAQTGGQTSRLNLHDAARPERRRQIAQPNTGRPCASPSPSLRSTSASAWPPNRTHRRRHRCESTTRRNMPPARRCLQRRLWTFPNAAIQARATSVNSCPKKTFRAAHTPPPCRRPPQELTPDRRSMPHYSPRYTTNSPLRCRIIDMPRKRHKNKPNTIGRDIKQGEKQPEITGKNGFFQ